MIPDEIKVEHIKKALEEIDKDAIPPRRESDQYDLEYNGKFYPPKYVISIANKYRDDGKELGSDRFSGGNETVEFLKSRGFSIRKRDIRKFDEDLLNILSILFPQIYKYKRKNGLG